MTTMNPLDLLRSKNPTVASICLQPLHVFRRLASRVLLVLLCLSGVAKADFTFDSATGTITGYTGAGGEVVIPASIDGTPVTAIGNEAFSPDYQGIQSITSVTIPNSVTSIGNYAFNGCSGLTSVTIGSEVTSIGSGAFNGCSGLTSVTIPDNVTSIGGNAFTGCSNLVSLSIGSEVTTIGNYAFDGCSSLTSVTIPDNVTSIGGNAFTGCSGLVSLWIGSGVTSIGNEAFAGCSGLTRVMIPVATVLGIEAFPSTTTMLRYLTDAQLTSRDSQQNAAGRVLGQADVTSAPASYSLYTAAQHAANYSSGQAAGRTAGQADVTSDPNTYGLYNLSQVQALNVDAPLLTRDAVSKKFKLTVKAKKSTDLVNFSDMPFVSADSTINSNGEMEFQFTSPDNAAFFRIESR
jgi:hypothetical protein